jgi:hypothetical protein
MADTKISGLPASTTPLAGTEVLPIVQSGVTRQVSVANLTAGRAVSATQMTLTTGSLIVASGQGIDFSATPGTGTSELFADYEEGTWTPVISGVTLTIASGKYTKVGRTVFVETFIRYPTTADTTNVEITGLPFTPVNGGNAFLGAVVPANAITAMTKSFVTTTGIQPVTAANARITNASFSGTDLQIGGWYSA